MVRSIKKNIVAVLAVLLFSTGITACSKTEKVLEKQTSVEPNKQGEKSTERTSEFEFKNGERSFKLEFKPKSEAEKVISEVLKIEISDDYNKLNELKIEQLDYSTFDKHLKDNNYLINEITIHNMRKLNEEEYEDNPNTQSYYPYMSRLTKFNPYEFQMIEVDYTKKVSEELDKVAQWGSGKWRRYYVMVKEKEDSSWKVYDVYGHM